MRYSRRPPALAPFVTIAVVVLERAESITFRYRFRHQRPARLLLLCSNVVATSRFGSTFHSHIGFANGGSLALARRNDGIPGSNGCGGLCSVAACDLKYLLNSRQIVYTDFLP
jgi:hypothetical protein